jgi:OOP family OmpA-OmpF porin
MRIKPMGKVILLIVAIGVAIGIWRLWGRIAPAAETKTAVVPTKIELPTGNGATSGTDTGGAASVVPISANLGVPGRPEVRLLGYAWNAQMGMLYALGGPQAAQGSLMAKHGVNLKFIRQDDNDKMQEALVSFATELSQGNPNPTKGANFVAIMGDGSAAFLQGLNATLAKLGPGYQAKIVDAIGYSRGEDKLMGPAVWKSNPNAARGSLVAGVVRDGDWNIAQKWLGDNNIPTNPDEKTYDPNAMNWVNASDYIDAAQKYVAGYSEDRPVVVNGKPTGQTKHVVVDGIVTWTPGDVTAAEKKGGIVSIVSTKEYSSQMPCTVIGIDKWMKANRPTVDNMIEAIAEGSQAVQTNPDALHQAAQISADVYHEPGTDAAYWEKYFKGTQEADHTGVIVDLGGSSVNNMADTLLAFGLVNGSADLVSATYTVFGNLVHSQYPELLPSVTPADQIVDKSYLQDASRQSAPTPIAITKAKPTYTKRVVKNLVGHRIWDIHFNAGQATFSPDAKKLLNELSGDLLVASGTVVEIHGYTDNQGSHATSLPLSQARAGAVMHYLQTTHPVNFPQGRIRVFAHGEANPIASNATAAGRAQNRRVEIILRSAT